MRERIGSVAGNGKVFGASQQESVLGQQDQVLAIVAGVDQVAGFSQ
jgi:hypothetical protein